MTRPRLMALCFALGSMCFLIGPLPGYTQLVGAAADGLTFFVGSIFFTLGGAIESWLAWPERRARGAGRAAWWSAVIQSAGTLFFNRSTFRAIQTTVSGPGYNKLVWRPDALGSVCFLISGVIAYLASSRRGWLPARGEPGWWQPVVNLLGCVFFGISAIAGHVVPSTGSMFDLAAANWNTCLARRASSPARWRTCAFRRPSPVRRSSGSRCSIGRRPGQNRRCSRQAPPRRRAARAPWSPGRLPRSPIRRDRGRAGSATVSCRPRSRTRAATSAVGLNGFEIAAPVQSDAATQSSSATNASRSGAAGTPDSSSSARTSSRPASSGVAHRMVTAGERPGNRP